MEQTLTATLWRLAALVALVFATGFFVAAEFSIVTVRKTRIDQLIAEGHRGARAVRRAVSAPDRYIAATQLGITMASLGLGWIGEPALASMIERPIEFLPPYVAAATAHTIAVAIAFTTITAVEIVLGELTPKWIALERSEMTAMWVVRPLELFMRSLWPFIRLVHGAAHAVISALGFKRADNRAMVHSEEELKMLVTASQEAGVLEEHEEQMLHRVFGFADLTAGQVMVPRTELVAGAACARPSSSTNTAARPVWSPSKRSWSASSAKCPASSDRRRPCASPSAPTGRPTSTAWRSSPTSTPSSTFTSTRTPIRPSAATRSAGSGGVRRLATR